jgi:hypothetical protein
MSSSVLRFLNHTQLDARQDSSGRVISPSHRPLTTHDNTTYKHKRQTSMPSARFESVIPASKRPKTYALDSAATGIGNKTYEYIPAWNANSVYSFLYRNWVQPAVARQKGIGSRQSRKPVHQLVACSALGKGQGEEERAFLGTHFR